MCESTIGGERDHECVSPPQVAHLICVGYLLPTAFSVSSTRDGQWG